MTETAPAAAPRSDTLVETISREPDALVLIGNPAQSHLTDTVALSIETDFRRRLGRLRWLAQGIACEYPVIDCNEPAHAIAAAVKEALAGCEIDVAVVPAADRRKRLLVADMDSTIIAEECIDELADAAGVRERVESITRLAMDGRIDFLAAITERVALLKGLEACVIERILADRITLNPGARELVATMRAHGAHAALVSGGFTQLVERIASKAGFTSFKANALEIENGRLTGRLVMPVLGASAKAEELRRLAFRHQLSLGQTLAVGDGANDVEMIASAGLGVAFRGKRILELAADASIRHGDLTALLYLQGYTRDDIRCATSPAPL